MVGFDFDDNSTKSEKRRIMKLFRISEIFIVLIFLTRALILLPFAVRISGEYLRQLMNIAAGHLFVFFLSNAIVLIIYLKSRSLFLEQDFQDSSETHVDFCRELNSSGGGGGASHVAGEIVYQDKHTILEVVNVGVQRKEKSLEENHHGGGCGKRWSEAEMVGELSNEEFKRAIEAFIAKQIKFHQEEELTIVLH